MEIRLLPAMNLICSSRILHRFLIGVSATSLHFIAAMSTYGSNHFESTIRPLLLSHCTDCHGPDKQSGSLRLDSSKAFHQSTGTESQPKDRLTDLQIRKFRQSLDAHPKKYLSSELTDQQIIHLNNWIESGAPWPNYPTGALIKSPDEEAVSNWWAIKPISSPPLPPDNNPGWARNEIDYFILSELEGAGLSPSPEASPTSLLRRGSFDLTGLPPSESNLKSFLNDPTDENWGHMVDTLLDSPGYGERWGQHWLDIVRWAESDGYRADDFRPHAWPYRDYVIRSFNQDKPYDEFIREQLAGDELDPDNPKVLIGTAFLRNGIYEWNQRDVRMHWDLIVNEVTDLTAEVFLGLGLQCARCHDHKFDPIPQKDYFRFKALLGTIRWNHQLQLATPSQKDEFARQYRNWSEATQSLRAEFNAIVEPHIRKKEIEALIKFPNDIQEMFAKSEPERSPFEQQLVELADYQLQRQRNLFKPDSIKGAEGDKIKELQKKLAAFDHLKPKPLPPAHAVTDIRATAPVVSMKTRKGQTNIQPGFLSAISPRPVDHIPPTEFNTSGRRKLLAEWITSPDNPLTARVMVNRIWQYHFGTGLVTTPNDFGKLGGPPSHPQLLDWLASRFIENGWKMKDLHRMIMQSSTYRQASTTRDKAIEIDPSNRLLWRFTPERLSAEQIRDAMLSVSGELTQGPGGPSVNHSSSKRSIYLKKMRNTPVHFLKQFDAPDGFDSQPERVHTTTPTQSLLFLNNEWPIQRAKAWAQSIAHLFDLTIPQGISHVFRSAYARNPSPGELEMMQKFLSPTNSPFHLTDKNQQISRLTDLCHAILTSNEFIYLD